MFTRYVEMGLPNLLTFLRIALIIPFCILFYVDTDTARWVQIVIFLVACATDYFDGYLARTLGQFSKIGRFLDPIADKLLVAVTLLFLSGKGVITGVNMIPAAIILSREILVSGLREFLAELHVPMPVTKMARWKTTIQLTALCGLLGATGGWFTIFIRNLGLLSLWLAALLTILTGYDYFRAALGFLKKE